MTCEQSVNIYPKGIMDICTESSLKELIKIQTSINSNLLKIITPTRKYDSGIKTISVSTSSQPSGCDIITNGTMPGYQIEDVNNVLRRNADRLYLINHGEGELYVMSSSNGQVFSSAESLIEEGSIKVFSNVYELRLRSPTSGCQYQITESEVPLFKINVIKAEKIEIISTDKDVHFTGAISMNDHEKENLTGLLGNKYFIRGVNIQSVQPLKYRLVFWGSDTFDNTSDLNMDSYIDDVELDMTTSPAFRINNANQYRLNQGALDIIYEDYDATKELHISLQNISATAKNAGATGEVQLDIKMSPRV